MSRDQRERSARVPRRVSAPQTRVSAPRGWPHDGRNQELDRARRRRRQNPARLTRRILLADRRLALCGRRTGDGLRAKTLDFPAIEQKLAQGALVNLNAVHGPEDLLGLLKSREDTAGAVFAAIERNRPLRNTGVLARVCLSPS
jgi:hypothetical protein